MIPANSIYCMSCAFLVADGGRCMCPDWVQDETEPPATPRSPSIRETLVSLVRCFTGQPDPLY